MKSPYCMRMVTLGALCLMMGTSITTAETVNTFQLNNGSQTINSELNVIGIGTESRFYVGNGAAPEGISNGVSELTIENGAAITVSGTLGDSMVIGRDGGTGTIIQNGGSLTFNVSKVLTTSGVSFNIGASIFGNTRALYCMNGGTLDMGGSAFNLGYYGNGAYTSALIQTGGVISNVLQLVIGGGASSQADVTLAGGTIVIGANGIMGKTPNGRLFLGGHTIKASSNWSTTFPMTLTGDNGPLIFETDFRNVLDSVISGTGALVKSGTGTLALAKACTYTGTTSIDSGTFIGWTGGSSVHSTFTVAPDAAIGVQVVAANGVFNYGPITIADGGTIDMDFQRFIPSATIAPFHVQGDLDIGVTPTVIIRNGGWQSAGTFPLIAYTGTFSGTLPAAPAISPAGIALTLTHDPAAKLISVVASPSAGVTWDGTDNDWNSPHWLPGNVPGPYSSISTALITNGTVYLQATDMFGPNQTNWETAVSPAIFLNNATLDSKGTYNTLWHLQMGGATLRCNGGANAVAQSFQLAGTLTVANLYGGNAPSRIIVADQPLNALNNVNIGGNGTPELTLQIDDVTGNADADLEIRANLQNWNGSGGRALIKTGPGTVLLAGNNTFTGGVTLNEGAVAVASGTALGTAAFTFASNTTLSATADLALANAVSISSGATGTIEVPETRALRLNGILSGGGALEKTGAGRLTLANKNTCSGAVTIREGTLFGQSSGSLPCAITVDAASGTPAGIGVTVNNLNSPWTCDALSFASAGELTVDFGTLAPNINTAPIQTTGNVDFLITPSVKVRLINSASITAGSKIALLKWGTQSGTAPTAVTIESLHPVTGHLIVEGDTLKLVPDSFAIIAPLKWTGAQTAVWNTNDVNWLDSRAYSTSYNQIDGLGDAVVFDNTGYANAEVILDQNVTPLNMKIDNALLDYTFSGPGTLSSPQLDKLGAKSLTLNTPVTTTSFFLNQGTVIANTNFTQATGNFYIGNANTAYDGTFIINTGAVIEITGATMVDQVVIGRDGGSGTIIQNGGLLRFIVPGKNFNIGASGNAATRAAYLMNDGILDMGGKPLHLAVYGNAAFSSTYVQTGGLVTNLSSLVLGDANYLNPRWNCSLNGGTMVIGSGGITGKSQNGNLSLGGGTLRASASWPTTSMPMALTGENGAFTFDTAFAHTFTGILSGNGGLTKTGTGRLTLQNTNTYTGVTHVAGGTLSVTGALASCAITVDGDARFDGTGTLAWHPGQTVTVHGTAELGGFSLIFGERPSTGEHTLVDYHDGTLVNGAGFAEITGIPSYAKVVHDTSEKTITLKIPKLGTFFSIQ